MNEMKTTILTRILQAALVLGAFIDANFELLSSIGLEPKVVNWIKVGGLVLAAILPSLLGKEVKLKDEIIKEK